MKDITSLKEWKKLFTDSFKKPIIIYKHSNGCHICAESDHILNNGIQTGKIKDKIHRIIVPQNRGIADEIAKDLMLTHQSPQIIIIKEGQVLYFANHYDISVEDIVLYMQQ